MRPHQAQSTIQSEIRQLYKVNWEKTVPGWPPDVFAIACHLLKHSGAYYEVVRAWPPSVKGGRVPWTEFVSNIGQQWRRAKDTKPPSAVQAWWRQLSQFAKIPISEVGSNRPLCEILLQLLAVSDEASRNFGIRGEEPNDVAAVEAWVALAASNSLCLSIDPSKVRVLPKLRTPQSGITIRSLSHHLAMIEGSEMRAYWWQPPIRHRDSLRLLLLPWPLSISKTQFEPVVSKLTNMPPNYGMFAYRAHTVPDIEDRIERVLDDSVQALRNPLGPDQAIDGLILPELALTPEDYERVKNVCMARGVFLISGVAKPPVAGSDSGYNCVLTSFADEQGIISSPEPQNKHHRWQLDGSQIKKYGLERQLDPKRIWWEATKIDKRRLTFVSMFNWLTLAVLICEDLARPDPVGDLIRSVGPNLVITLLMDGPQETYRWASRYALALGDDPGSSVLTLTSLGMTQLASLNDKHKIALWKDYRRGQPISVNMPDGASGVVLYIRHEDREAWTADGRRDHSSISYPVLRMVIPVGAGAVSKYEVPVP